MKLSDIPTGRRARVRFLNGHPDSRTRLRDLGIFENAVVRCVLNRDPIMICGIWESRVGITHDLARTIVVSSMDEE